MSFDFSSARKYLKKKYFSYIKIQKRLLSTSPNMEQELRSVDIALDNVTTNLDAIATYNKERTTLIDIQIHYQNFGGELHEAYHLVCISFDTSINNFFSSLKRLFNSIAILIYESQGHEQRRVLTKRSFGSMMEKVKKIWPIVDPAFLEMALQIDDVFLQYRDKQIEHAQGFEFPSIESNNKGIIRVHQRFSRGNIARKPPPKQSGLLDWIRINVDTGGYIYYVHVVPPLDTKQGSKLKKGQLLGQTSDNGSGHFKKFGPHIHTFFSPNINPEMLRKAQPGIYDSINAESPDIIWAYGYTLDFLSKTLLLIDQDSLIRKEAKK